MTTTQSTPTRGTHKAHGRPTVGYYYGDGNAPAQTEGTLVVFTAVARAGVYITTVDGGREWIGGMAGKFWFAPIDIDQLHAEALAENALADLPLAEIMGVTPTYRRGQAVEAQFGPSGWSRATYVGLAGQSFLPGTHMIRTEEYGVMPAHPDKIRPVAGAPVLVTVGPARPAFRQH